MRIINVKPVEIVGACPAGLKLTDEFQIAGMRLENPGNSTLCLLAVSQIPIGQGIWQLQTGEGFFSHVTCPGCIRGPERENRVVLLLGHADKWQLCQAISRYLSLRQKYGEPESAVKLRNVAIGQQNRGDYSAATETMKAAVEELAKGGTALQGDGPPQGGSGLGGVHPLVNKGKRATLGREELWLESDWNTGKSGADGNGKRWLELCVHSTRCKANMRW
jgi:hypothetical protein